MLMRRAILFGGGAAVLLVILAVAGWWLFVREDADLATEPPDIPSDLVDATSEPEPGGDVLTFRIVPEESEAAYFVDEELASLPLPSTAKGATTAIEGEFHLTTDGAGLAPGFESRFTVDLTTLQSDEDRRDNRVQDALQTSLHPAATFTVAGVTGFDASLADGEQQDLVLTGTLDLHGVQREVSWEVEARREGNVISALATVSFAFSDFNITPPNIAGFVSVSDEATLQVQVIAQVV
ncbi:MAG: YceI family protein [Dehalococcoidia bacterium]